MHMQRPPEQPMVSGPHPSGRIRPTRQGPRGGSSPQIDVVRMVKGNAWWLIQGLAIGLVVGYLHFRSLPPLFRSSAKVQIIESSSKNMPVDDLEGGATTRSLSDEVLVMRSERILAQAAILASLVSGFMRSASAKSICWRRS